MGFSNIQRAKRSATTMSEITKDDLIDQQIAFELKGTDAEYETSYGTSFKAEVDIIVCSGPRRGEQHSDFWVFGNLGKQLAGAVEDKVGESSIVKVIKGPNYYGCEDLNDSDFEQASAFVAEIISTKPKSKSKAKATAKDDSPAPF